MQITEPIVCKPTSWFTVRAVVMLVMFSVFSVMFFIDGTTGYRKKNLEYYIEAAFDQADRDFKKMKSDGELSPESWKEFASKQEVTLDSDLSLLPAGTKNPMAWPAILTDFERMKSGQPHLLWQEYSGEMRMSKTPPKKPFSAGKIRDQFIVLYVCLTLVVITLFFLIRNSFRSMRADSNVFTTASGKIIPYKDMKTLDLRKWDTKGIASSSNPMNNESLPVWMAETTGGDFFDEIVVGRFTRISFHRTLRIPEDGRDYPLPAGLGRFPIHRVEDYADKVPAKWLQEGGFFIPIYQKEALYLQFEGPHWHPSIAKVCVGRINAITGKPYHEDLLKNQQDYIVIPNQTWLDGICTGEGLVRQFVAMPLGQGYTIEAQITDEEKFGGFQIVVMNAVEGRFPERDRSLDRQLLIEEENRRKGIEILYQMGVDDEMGVAAGGSIKQQIQKDTYGIESWCREQKQSLTIHLINSIAYKAITGINPPSSPITVEEYERAKIPWYSYYDETAPSVKPHSLFKRMLGIAGIEKNRGSRHKDEENLRMIYIQKIKTIRTPDKKEASLTYRKRARDSKSKGFLDAAIREISYVIDLDVNTCAEDFVFRSSCNYQVGNFRDGVIDATFALYREQESTAALTWRALCRLKLGAHEDLDEDADALLKIPETELIGLEMKAEAALLAGRYDDALKTAMKLKIRHAGHIRADEICNFCEILSGT